jgi:hypothetical protein
MDDSSSTKKILIYGAGAIIAIALILYAMKYMIKNGKIQNPFVTSSSVSSSLTVSQPYSFIAVSDIDGQIYTKATMNPNDTYFQITYLFPDIIFTDAYQFNDGWMYGVTNQGEVIKITNDLKSNITPQELNKNNKTFSKPWLEIHSYAGIPTVMNLPFPAPHISKIIQNPIDSSFQIIDNYNLLYQKKFSSSDLLKIYYNFYQDPTVLQDTPLTRQIKFTDTNASIFTVDVSQTNSKEENLYVLVSNGMGDSAKQSTNDMRMISMKYLSDRTFICVGSDMKLYTKETISSYPVKLANNTLNIMDVCVLPGDEILGVQSPNGKVFMRNGGIQGVWDTSPIDQSCCCQRLNIFYSY